MILFNLLNNYKTKLVSYTTKYFYYKNEIIINKLNMNHYNFTNILKIKIANYSIPMLLHLFSIAHN